MRKTIVIALLFAGFNLLGVNGAVFAGGVGSDCGGCSAAGNNEKVANGIKLTEEAIEHAKQGHAKETEKVAAEAARVVGDIVTGVSNQARKKSKAVYELNDAKRRARDGKLDESIAFLEKALKVLGTIEPFK